MSTFQAVSIEAIEVYFSAFSNIASNGATGQTVGDV